MSYSFKRVGQETLRIDSTMDARHVGLAGNEKTDFLAKKELGKRTTLYVIYILLKTLIIVIYGLLWLTV